MKKVISFVLCVVMSFTFLNFAFAAESNSGDTGNPKETVRDLTYDQAINLLMEKKGYSLSEARSVLGENVNILGEGYIYREFASAQDFGKGASIEYGVLAKIYVYDSFRQFDSIADKWSLPRSGEYTFTLGYHSPVVNTPPSTMSDLARGQVEYAITFSSSREANIAIGEFVQAGYSYSTSVGYTYYFRKTQSFSTTYSLY